MKLAILCFSLCGLVSATGTEYGEKIPLKRIPGVTEGAMAAELYGNTLYVAGSRGTLFAFDVSRPAEPKPISKLRVLKSSRQLAIRNGIAAVTGRQHGIAFVDVRNPARPELLSRYHSVELATGIDLTSKYAFVSNRVYGVETVDLSDPRRPRHLGNLLTREAHSVNAYGNRLVIGDWAAGKILMMVTATVWMCAALSFSPRPGIIANPVRRRIDRATGTASKCGMSKIRFTPRGSPVFPFPVSTISATTTGACGFPGITRSAPTPTTAFSF